MSNTSISPDDFVTNCCGKPDCPNDCERAERSTPIKPDAPPDDPTFDFAELKRQVREERKRARMPNRAHRACFWTWPWGHVWKVEKMLGPRLDLFECAVCGKRKVM